MIPGPPPYIFFLGEERDKCKCVAFIEANTLPIAVHQSGIMDKVYKLKLMNKLSWLQLTLQAELKHTFIELILSCNEYYWVNCIKLGQFASNYIWKTFLHINQNLKTALRTWWLQLGKFDETHKSILKILVLSSLSTKCSHVTRSAQVM